MRNLALNSLLVATASMTFAAPAGAKTTVQTSSGVNYSSGDYGGAEDTDVLVVPFAVKVKSGPWAFRASLPYLRIDGPANVAAVEEAGGGTSTVDTGTSVARTKTVDGIGDLSLTATYTFDKILGDKSYLDMSGRVRLPTGDDKKGLGTGATDYIVKGELGRSIGDGGVYVSAGRRFLGDANGVNRKDGWQAGAGAWYSPTKKMTLGAYYDWRNSSTGLSDDPSEIGAFASYRVTDAVKLGLDVSAGLSDGSPDYGIGLTLSYRTNFNPR